MKPTQKEAGSFIQNSHLRLPSFMDTKRPHDARDKRSLFYDENPSALLKQYIQGKTGMSSFSWNKRRRHTKRRGKKNHLATPKGTAI